MNATEGVRRIALSIKWIGDGLAVLLAVAGAASWIESSSDKGFVVLLFTAAAISFGAGRLSSWIIAGFSGAPSPKLAVPDPTIPRPPSRDDGTAELDALGARPLDQQRKGGASGVRHANPLFLDFGYYLKWWLLWGGLGGLLTYADGSSNIAVQKLIQVGTGLAMGASCAVLFAVGQNRLNPNRRKVTAWVLAIGIWMLVKGGLVVLNMQWQEAQVRQAVADGERELEQLKSIAAKKYPDRSQSEAMKEVQIAKSKQQLADLSNNKAEQRASAAGLFLGFYLLNSKARPEYCRELGEDISSFTKPFEQMHAREFERASGIAALEGTTVSSLYVAMTSQLRSFVETDMKSIAESKGVDLHGACRYVSTEGKALANQLIFEKQNADAHRILMSPP